MAHRSEGPAKRPFSVGRVRRYVRSESRQASHPLIKGLKFAFLTAPPMFDADQGHHRMRRVDWRIEYEFNMVFMTTSENGKEALIKRWTDRKNCDRQEAMRLAIEERRRDNR